MREQFDRVGQRGRLQRWELVLLFGLGGAVAPLHPQETDIATCAQEDCHPDLAAAFQASPHAVVDLKGLAGRADAAFSCAACHGDVDIHVDDDGGPDNIFAFKPSDSAPGKVERCLACHAGGLPRFPASPHARDGLDCQVCHSVHQPAPGG
ncbi:MAG: hypothetical protein V3U35_08095, partial [Candidatus Neomarinimicrobiota bacterium]